MRYNHKQSGFSLVETLVAITILLIVIVGPMTIVATSARSTSFSSEQVTAFFLAQEGAELIEKARDDAWLESFMGLNATPWASFTDTRGVLRWCYASTGCGVYIDTDNEGDLMPPLNCSSIDNCYLYLDTTTSIMRSRFTHVAGTNERTPFTRRIFLQQINANEVQVTSTVTWRSGSVREEQVVNVETRLFNIYETS